MTSESLTERQKIVRLASANDSVSSKMSRSKKTLIQPSGENCQTHAAIGAGRQERIDQHDQQRADARRG